MKKSKEHFEAEEELKRKGGSAFEGGKEDDGSTGRDSERGLHFRACSTTRKHPHALCGLTCHVFVLRTNSLPPLCVIFEVCFDGFIVPDLLP